jgi:hypothetical protein
VSSLDTADINAALAALTKRLAATEEQVRILATEMDRRTSDNR